jgi:stage V sporulation protein G
MINKESKMKAVVSVTFDDCFVVHDIKVIEGEKGLFIAMPSKKTPDGEYRDIAHPINSEMRGRLEKTILEVFEEEQAKAPETDEGGEIADE